MYHHNVSNTAQCVFLGDHLYIYEISGFAVMLHSGHNILSKFVSLRGLCSQVNWVSHSVRLSCCMTFRSDRSSYSSFRASFSRQKVARPLDASRPANTPYGPSAGREETHSARGECSSNPRLSQLWTQPSAGVQLLELSLSMMSYCQGVSLPWQTGVCVVCNKV